MMPMGGLGLQPTWKEIFNHPVIQVFVCFLDLCAFAFHFYFYLKILRQARRGLVMNALVGKPRQLPSRTCLLFCFKDFSLDFYCGIRRKENCPNFGQFPR
jgi:hypothetical protein